MSFNKWKDEYGLEFEPNYSKETELDCKAAFKAGQQSRQAEIGELNLKINRLIESEENIARGCKGWRDAHRELDERIIKALDMLEGREGKVLFEDILDVLKGIEE